MTAIQTKVGDTWCISCYVTPDRTCDVCGEKALLLRNTGIFVCYPCYLDWLDDPWFELVTIARKLDTGILEQVD